MNATSEITTKQNRRERRPTRNTRPVNKTSDGERENESQSNQMPKSGRNETISENKCGVLARKKRRRTVRCKPISLQANHSASAERARRVVAVAPQMVLNAVATKLVLARRAWISRNQACNISHLRAQAQQTVRLYVGFLSISRKRTQKKKKTTTTTTTTTIDQKASCLRKAYAAFQDFQLPHALTKREQGEPAN